MSCAIPPEIYKYSKAVVRLWRGEERLRNQTSEARRGKTHSQGNIEVVFTVLLFIVLIRVNVSINKDF